MIPFVFCSHAGDKATFIGEKVDPKDPTVKIPVNLIYKTFKADLH